MFEILQELPKCDTTKMSKCYWKSGTSRLAQHRVTTNQFVKNAIFAMCNKAKCDKTGCACVIHKEIYSGVKNSF